jgi:hypothetical protein
MDLDISKVLQNKCAIPFIVPGFSGVPIRSSSSKQHERKGISTGK